MSVPTDSSDLADRIRHAESYPFARPACSYLFAGEVMHPVRPEALAGRMPIVASGSNASPSRLFAKFGKAGRIPVTRATLNDFAVVFAGHFTAYGAIPATLAPSEGAVTEVWITWLTPSELTVMHRSEGVIGCREAEQRYDFLELSKLDLRSEHGDVISEAGAYLSRRMLALDGEPIRLAEVWSRNCHFRSLSERAALRHVHARLDQRHDYSGFMSNVLRGAVQRQALFEQLTPHVIDRGREGASRI